MTKDRYYEMCEMMGSEPIAEEIPVDFEDLILEAQEAFRIYNNLQDSWDYMNGNYIGKNLTNIKDILDLFEVPKDEQRVMYELIIQIDSLRSKSIKEAKKS